MIRRAFVSDVHMSAGWSLNGRRGRYDWLDAVEANNFKEMYADMSSRWEASHGVLDVLRSAVREV